MKYEVRISEELARTIEVEAENENEAYDKAHDMYRNCEVVLDSNDFVGEPDIRVDEEKKDRVWVVTPWNEPSLSKVFSSCDKAEKWFKELHDKYCTPYDSNNIEDCLDNGSFLGYRYGRDGKELPMAMYTINSFEVEE